MKKAKKLTVVILISVLVACFFGAGTSTKESIAVQKGFAFGPPVLQQRMDTNGEYVVRRWGYPGTYREVQIFRGAGENPYEVSYTSRAFSLVTVVANIVFLMSFIVALLSPITIFWRPQKKSTEVKPTEKKTESQVKKAHADTRD